MKNPFIWAVLALLLFSCKSIKNTQNTPTETVFLDTIEVSAFNPMPPIQHANDIVFDLLHTQLKISFDFKNEWLLGEANLTLTPYFFSQNVVQLDAKSMKIHSVSASHKNLDLAIDSFKKTDEKLKVYLSKTLSKSDTIQLNIKYTSMPNEASAGGGDAIRSDKGLYFINANKQDQYKPTQVWTQGEPEANSNWFPTLDSPNQKTTQEVEITVPENFTTLCNGVLDFSTLNGDGTRTDYWSQNLPHSPYLFMLAIGEYAVVEDEGYKIPVSYFVEPDFEEDAKNIFKYTPEMLAFFSEILGVEYPWQKYHQVVVRDYVSGAMENTTAVIFGEFVQKTSRELIDGDNQDIVAHEMFHHWFGDLITCEGWGNLTVNESFATYAPYLWREFKYGKLDADRYLWGNKNAYFDESIYKQEKLVRTHFQDPLEMFDRHSYSKGSVILHMLRKQLGDEAFFRGLQLFLTDNAFQAVEATHLKLALEKVSGKNLDVFFNQWYFSSGHPEITVDYYQNLENETVKLVFAQKEHPENIYPYFILPTQVLIQSSTTDTLIDIVLQNRKDSIVFHYSGQLQNVLVDPEGILLASWQHNKSFSWWKHQFYSANSFEAQYTALQKLAVNVSNDTLSKEVVIDALSDDFFSIVNAAIDYLPEVLPYKKEVVFEKCQQIAQSHTNPQVRANALKLINRYYANEVKIDFMQKMLSDSSINVLGEALVGIYKINPELGLMLAEEYQDQKAIALQLKIAALYAEAGAVNKQSYFAEMFNRVNANNKTIVVKLWSKYIEKLNQPQVTLQFVPVIEMATLSETSWWIRLRYIESLYELQTFYSNNPNNNEINTSIIEQIGQSIGRIIEKETNPQLLYYLGR